MSGPCARGSLGHGVSVSRTTRTVFVGVAREAAAQTYLSSVRRAVGTRFDTPGNAFRVRPGGPPSLAPAQARIWSATATVTGAGTRTLSWTPQAGDWRIVLMNVDGSADVNADVSIGARLPHLLAIAIAVLGAGLLLLIVNGGGVYAAARRRG